MYKVAVIDDDKQFLQASVEYLVGRGFAAHGYTTLSAALQRINNSYSVSIIDIHLNDGDGFTFLEKAKVKFPSMKTIVITGIDELPKRLKSFAKGADDYMKKPIFPAELVARINRLLYKPNDQTLPSEIDPKLLTIDEQKLLKILLSAKGAVVPLEVFKRESFTRNSVYITIHRLKNKIAPKMNIKCAYGRGYFIEKIN